MAYLILTASYTNNVSTLEFDPAKGTLNLVSALTAGHHPSWITAYPGDSSLVFTGLEQSDGKVVVLKFDAKGKGEVVASVSSGGRDPASLLATKDTLYVANYSSGTIATYPISSKAPYLLSETPQTIQVFGTGPNKDRQEASHPHQVIIHDQHNELLVPDLGADKVRRFSISQGGSLKEEEPIECSPGDGPRHVAFHDGNIYTLLELTSRISKHTFPATPSAPALVASKPTMSNPPALPNDMLAAEILIPPTNASFPTPYIYVSNRNDPSPEGDIISIFSTDTLELVAEVRSGLNHVRGIVFGGPDDKWLVAGGVNGGGVKVFERVDGGKGLKEIAHDPTIEAPTGFLWK